MAADPVDPEMLKDLARNAPLTRPRPSHADLAGMQKHGFDDARPVLERALARETAARVALGAIARSYLKETVGIEIVSHVVELCSVKALQGVYPTPADVEKPDADPLRCLNGDASEAMAAEADQDHKDGDTLGGVIEVLAHGVPVGLGSHVHWDRELNARLAGAPMAIQAIKGVEIGDGFERAPVPGSQAHDEIVNTSERIRRVCGRAGGTDGGLTTGARARSDEAARDGAACSEDGRRRHRRGRTRPSPALRRHRGPRRRQHRRGHGGPGPCGRRHGNSGARPAATCSPASTICRSGERAEGPPRRAEQGRQADGGRAARGAAGAFWDAGADIVAAQGQIIEDIFVTQGEAHLWALEKAAVATALTEHVGTLARGGGAVLDTDTGALLAGQRIVHLPTDTEEEAKCTGLNAARPRPAVHPQQQRLLKPPSTHGR